MRSGGAAAAAAAPGCYLPGFRLLFTPLQDPEILQYNTGLVDRLRSVLT